MSDSPISIVVFDLGGVMIQLAGGWEAACECAGFAPRPFTFTPEMRAKFAQLEHGIESGSLDVDEFARLLQQVVDDQFTAAELCTIYLAVIQHELPGIYEIVTGLKAAGYRTACLSNTCALHWPVLTDPQCYPAIGQLDYQCASHLFGVRKPDLAVYRHFEDFTGFAGPQILFFDDREENIQAAQECGWHAVLIKRSVPAAEQMYAAFAAHGMSISCDTTTAP